MISIDKNKYTAFYACNYKNRQWDCNKNDGAPWNRHDLYRSKTLSVRSDQLVSTLYYIPDSREIKHNSNEYIDEIFKNIKSSTDRNFFLYNPKYNKSFLLSFYNFHSIQRKK